MSSLGDVLSKVVYSNVSQTGVWGLSPQPPVAMGVWGQRAIFGRFVSFWKKKLFKSHWITFRTSSEPFQRTRFLTFQCQSKKFSCSILFLQLDPNTFRILHYSKILIVSDLVYWRSKAHCLLQYFSSK